MKSYLILILILFIFTFIYHIHSQFNNQFKWIQDIDYSSSIISRISISLSSFSFSSMSTYSQYNSISLSSLWTMWIGIGVESDLWTTLSFPTIQWNQLSNHSLWNGFALSSVSSTQRFINTSSIDSHSFICIWDSTSTNHSISIQTDNEVFNGIHLHSCSKWICGSSDWERESSIQRHSSGWYHWFLSQSLIDSSFSISLSISIHSHFTVSLQNRFRLYHQSSSSQFNCWRLKGDYVGDCRNGSTYNYRNSSRKNYVPKSLIGTMTRIAYYSTGAGYMISMKALPKLLTGYRYLPFIAHNEDVNVGRTMSLVGIPCTVIPKWRWNKGNDSEDEYVIIHKTITDCFYWSHCIHQWMIYWIDIRIETYLDNMIWLFVVIEWYVMRHVLILSCLIQ